MATSTQIVWTYIFELMFLHEILNGWSLAGTGLIMGYMLVVGVLKMIPSGEPQEEMEPLLTEAEEKLGQRQHLYIARASTSASDHPSYSEE